MRQRLTTIAIVAACAGAASLPATLVAAQDATDQLAPAAEPQPAPRRAQQRRPARQVLTPPSQLPVPPAFIAPPGEPPTEQPSEQPRERPEAPPAPPSPAAAPTPPIAPPQAAPPAPVPPAPVPPAPPAAAPVAPTPRASAPEAPAAAPPPPDRQSRAALPAPLTLAFRPGDSTLPGAARTLLENFARAAPPDDSNTRLMVIGYGDDPDGDVSRARRLALARAIEARHVLIEAGIRSTRIDVRALGRPADAGSPDRVEVSVNAGARQMAPATPGAPPR